MTGERASIVTLCFAWFGLLCWIVMFMAGHDVWHDVGRPDIWNIAGVPYHDLRVFVVAYYLLLPVLVFQVLAGVRNLRTPRRLAARRTEP
jgi:hypothetical protein